MNKKHLLFVPALLLVSAASLTGCTKDDVANLSSRIGVVESDISALKEEVASLKKQITNLEEELAKNVKALQDDYGAKANALQKQIDEGNNELVLLKAKLESDKKALEDDYNKKITDLNAALDESVAVLAARITEDEAEIKRLEEKHDAELKAAKEDYDSKITALDEKYQSSVIALQEQIDGNEGEIAKLGERHDADKKSLEDDYKKKINDLDSKYASEVASLKGSAGENAEAIKALSDKLESDKKALEDDYNKKVEGLDTKLKTEVAALADAIKANSEAMTALSAQHEKDRKSLEDDYNKKIDDLDSKYDAEVAKLEKGIDDNASALTKFKSDYESDRKAIIADYDTKITALADDYKKKVAAIEADIDGLGKQITSLQTELEGKIQALKDGYDTQIKTINSRLSEIEKTTYYTVSFNTYGGTVIPSQSIERAGHITKPADPARTGYDFQGWRFNGIDVGDEFFLYYTVDRDITIEAVYTIQNYSLEVSLCNDGAGYFTINLESGNKNKYKANVDYGTNVTVTAYELNGATFNNWTKDGNVVSTNKAYTFKMAAACCLVANYTLPPIKCEFKNYDGTLIATQYVEKGTNVIYGGEVPTKPKTGLNYNSWNGWDKSLNNITEDTVFTAQFKDTGDVYYHYCVFVNYDGEQLASDSTFSGGTITYKGDTPTRPQGVDGTNITNYTFSAWDTSLSNITGYTVLTAKYSYTKFTGYKVDFIDSDSTPLYSYYCKSGTTAIYPYSLPFTYDSTNVKMFVSWGGSLENITEPKTFKAQYKTISRAQNGEYPTSLVKDTATITALDAISVTDAKGYKQYNGNKYLRKYNSGSYVDNYKETVTPGYHYYLVEPIQWRYLTTSGSNVFVTSEYIIDAKRYGEGYSGTKSKTDYNGFTADAYANNYKFSELRTFLNTTFLDQAFADSSAIAVTDVDNSVASTGYSKNPYVCPTTSDKVFALSYKEVTEATYGFGTYAGREAKTTEYARAAGVYYDSTLSSDYLFNGSYWLRSPRYNRSSYARYVNYDVSVYYNDVSDSSNGVRPALNLGIA